jgi:F-type H+-transporting ATPase subunit epsilon
VSLHVTVVSPERALYDGQAEAVVAPAFDGLVGILPRHAPFMTLLGDGVLTVRNAGTATRFRVSGGFLQVVRTSQDTVRIVTDRVAEFS